MTLRELKAQQDRRRRLLDLTLFCTVTLAVVVLAACGPSDVDIARSGTPVTEPKVVAMSAVPAEPLVTIAPTTTTAPPVTAAPTTPCPRCKGTGKVRASSGRSGIPSRDFRCRDCWGYGVVVEREESA